MVAIGWGLLQGGVRDLCLFGGISGRLEKVGDEEDLPDTEEEEQQKEEASSSHDVLHPGDFVLYFVVAIVPHSSSFFQHLPAAAGRLITSLPGGRGTFSYLSVFPLS